MGLVAIDSDVRLWILHLEVAGDAVQLRHRAHLRLEQRAIMVEVSGIRALHRYLILALREACADPNRRRVLRKCEYAGDGGKFGAPPVYHLIYRSALRSRL